MSEREREPTMRDRFVGAAIASPSIGPIVCLFLLMQTALRGASDPMFALIVGSVAVGFAGAVLYTFGVVASALIDTVLGHRPLASVAAHVIVGAAAGFVVVVARAGASEGYFGAFLGADAAAISVHVARTGPHGPWGILIIMLVAAATLAFLAGMMFW